MADMVKPPESTKTSLRQRLTAHARQRWPQLTDLTVRYHGAFAYVDGHLADGTTLPLCRLRYGGSAHPWGLAIYRASHDDYEDSILPAGHPAGTPQQTPDRPRRLHPHHPAPRISPPPPTN